MKNPFKSKFIPFLNHSDRFDWFALSIISSAFLTLIFLVTQKYHNFGYWDWDLGLFANAMWYLAHGSFYSSIFGINFLANHANFIALLILPLYSIFQHPLTLVFLKILSFTGGAVVLYVYGKKQLGPVRAIGVVFLFLLFPANLFTIFYEFDFETLNVVFLFLLLYFLQENKVRPFLITLFFLLLIKENMSFIAITFGLYGLVAKKDDKMLWGMVPILLGGMSFFLYMFVFVPMIRSHMAVSRSMYWGIFSNFGLTPLEIIKNILINPALLIPTLNTSENQHYLLKLLLPLMFLPLLRLDILFLCCPILLIHLLSNTPQMKTILYHYPATLTPFLFIALIQGLYWLDKKMIPTTRNIIFFLLIISSLANLHSRRHDLSFYFFKRAHYPDIVWSMIHEIPKDKPGLGSTNFMAQLSQRKDIYPALHVIRGRNGYGGGDFVLPPVVEYALIDFQDAIMESEIMNGNLEEITPRVQSFTILNDWRVQDAAEDVVLFKRGGTQNPIKLLEISKDPFNLNVDYSHRIDDTVGFALPEIGKENFGHKNLLHLIFNWKSGQDLNNAYILRIRLKENGKEVKSVARRVGYFVYPQEMWKKGQYIRENYWLVVPQLFKGHGLIEFEFFKLGPDHRLAKIRDENTGPITIEFER